MDTEQQQQLQRIEKALLREYKKDNLREVLAMPEAQALMEEHRDVGVVLKFLCERKEENQTVDAFYIGIADILDWNEKEEVMVKVGEGTKVWLPDGKTRVFKDVKLQGTPLQTTVQVTPCTVMRNIVEDTVEVIVPQDATVTVAEHNSEHPTNPTVSEYIQRIEKRKDKKRGVLRGDSGDTPILLRGIVGEGEDDVSYFPPQENPQFGDGAEKLSIVVYDKNGDKVKVSKADAQQVRDAYGLSPSAGSQEYRHALAGEPVVLMGKMGIFVPFEGRNINSEDPSAGNKVLEEYAEKLRRSNLISKTKAKGREVEALNLSKVENADHVVIEGHRVYDFKQEPLPNGDLVWKGAVRATDAGGQPWMWCTEKTLYAKDENGVPTNEVDRVMNAGAGIHYLNRLGGKVRLSESDPFALLGNQLGLGDFQDKEPAQEAPIEQ